MKNKLHQKIKEVLKKVFTDETVYVTKGCGDNVHIVIVSEKFKKNAHGSYDSHNFVLEILDKSDLKDNEKSRISLIMTYHPEELR